MSEQIVVTIETVDSAADDLDTITTRMRDILADMDVRLRPLEVDWTGAASEAYRRSQQVWNTDITEMVDLLGTLSTVVDTAGRTYETTEGDVRSAWA